MNDLTVNANVAKCLQSMTHLGFQRIHNLCSGAITDVPWGFGEWALCVAGTAIAITFIVMFSALAVAIIRD